MNHKLQQRGRVVLVTTGGTIEKTYDERSGTLANQASVLTSMLRRLRLAELDIGMRHVLAKDSLQITDAERRAIVEAVLEEAAGAAVVVLHGTDTLVKTGRALHERSPRPPQPICLTGAMRPFGYEQSDAVQNLTEAILAARLLPPGVYVVFHGLTLPLPHVRKDRATGHFLPEA
jgi:L-asparaginase